MKENLTEVVFVLDRSGSMHGLEKDTIGGFNGLIDKQRKAEGETDVTLVLFDDTYELVYDRIPVREVPELTEKTYEAGGCTALYDAVGRTIDAVGKRLADTPEEERPSKVLFVITTDGLENASREYNPSRVREMIRHQRDKYSWEFLFLGANIDTVEVAADMGISASHAVSYRASSRGISDMYCFLGAFIDDPRPTGSWTRKKDALMKEGQDEGKDTPSPTPFKARKKYPRAFY